MTTDGPLPYKGTFLVMSFVMCVCEPARALLRNTNILCYVALLITQGLHVYCDGEKTICQPVLTQAATGGLVCCYACRIQWGVAPAALI